MSFQSVVSIVCLVMDAVLIIVTELKKFISNLKELKRHEKEQSDKHAND